MKKKQTFIEKVGLVCLYAFALVWNLPKTLKRKITKQNIHFTLSAQKTMAFALAIVMMITALPLSHVVANAAGNTSVQDIVLNKEEKTIKIYTAQGLVEYAQQYYRESNYNVTLMNDIDLSSFCGERLANWVAIPYLYSTFDGNGKTISNLYVNTTEGGAGLFYDVKRDGVVKNLTVEVNITCGSSASGITDYANGRIENCIVNGQMRAINGGTAGIANVCSGTGSIINCVNNATLFGKRNNVGGIAGSCYGGKISGCINTGDIEAIHYGAGISTYASEGAVISNCTNTGNIIGQYEAAGIIGGIVSNGQMKGCYSTGNVTCSNKDNTPGLLVSYWDETAPNPVENCYYLKTAVLTGADGKIESKAFGKAEDGAYAFGKTAEEMKTDAFVESLNGADGKTFFMDYTNINGGYPVTVVQLTKLFAVGAGTVDAPFEILTPEQLSTFSGLVNVGYAEFCAKLMADIDLSGICGETKGSWTPIGTSSKPYDGIFDAKNYTISNLYINGTDKSNQALFGAIGANGKVQDLSVSGTITAQTNVAGIAANNSGTIANCAFDGSVTANGGNAGGIAANNSAAITNCVNKGKIQASGDIVGGIAGTTLTSGSILNCYNKAEISGNSMVGGVVGQLSGGKLQNTYNVGAVSANSQKGGISGTSGTITNSYYLNTCVSGGNTVTGATAKTSADMQQADFIALLNGTETAFSADIIQINSGYPILPYEIQNLFDDGDGTATAPYEISTASQLVHYRNLMNTGKTNHCAKLIADIDLSSVCGEKIGSWVTIGNTTNKYIGSFNGGDFSISGLYINEPTLDYQGLFGYIDDAGSVTHLKLTNSYVSGKSYVGGIAGHKFVTNTTSEVDDQKFNYLTTSGTVIGAGDYVGGIAGIAHCITHSNNYSTVSGVNNVGGVIGTAYIANLCSNFGDVTGTGEYTGGISGPGVYKCDKLQNDGNIEGTKYVGGIMGASRDIDECGWYVGLSNSGTVHGTDKYVGGIVGYFEGEAIKMALNLGDVTSDSDSVGGICGATRDWRNVGFLQNVLNAGQIRGKGDYVGNIIGYRPGYDESYKADIENAYYVKGYAINLIDNSVKNAFGETEDIEGSNTKNIRTIEEQSLHTGEATYHLNSSPDNDYFAQTLRGENKDQYPVLMNDNHPTAKIVIRFQACHYYDTENISVTLCNDGDRIGDILPEDFKDCSTFISTKKTFGQENEIVQYYSEYVFTAITAPTYTVTVPTGFDFGEQYLTHETDPERYATLDKSKVTISAKHLEINKKQVRVSLQSDLSLTNGEKKIPFELSYSAQKTPLQANTMTQLALITGNDANMEIPFYAVLDRSKLLYDKLALNGTVNFTITLEDVK